jgi:hypothetical protein
LLCGRAVLALLLPIAFADHCFTRFNTSRLSQSTNVTEWRYVTIILPAAEG